MLKVYRQCWQLLTSAERRRLIGLSILMIVTGIFEVSGVASVMPFLGAITQSDSNMLTHELLADLNFDQRQQQIVLGIAVVALMLLALASKALTQWFTARFVWGRNHSVGLRLLRNYLYLPYENLLARHSADFAKSLLSEVQISISQVLMPALQLLANAVVVVALLALLLVVEPRMAIAASVVLSGLYGLVYVGFRGYLTRIGQQRVRANEERFIQVQEAMGGIKELKTMDLASLYLSRYAPPSLEFARYQANNTIIGELPSYVLQALIFGGVISFVLYLLVVEGNELTTVLPTLALFGFAAYRLMPALQRIYRASAQMRFGSASLQRLIEELEDTEVNPTPAPAQAPVPLTLERSLDFDNISFTYPGADSAAFEQLSLHIPARSFNVLIGPSGAGKTTLVDITLGLLTPQQGRVCVDGEVLNTDNGRAWLQSIGYVPQQPFLIDDTIKANVILGSGAFDQELFIRVCTLTGLDKLTNATEGYATRVGERGALLSGGQRQRLALARALYRQPSLLILDEATNALDEQAEAQVLNNLRGLTTDLTVLMITHRVQTLAPTDRILHLSEGSVTISTQEQILQAQRVTESSIS